MPVFPSRSSGFTDIQIQPSIIIDIDKGDPAGPDIFTGYSCVAGDVSKGKIALINQELIVNKVSTEV